MKTITKASEELGVSRTKIYTLIKKLNISTKRGSKTNLIEDNDYEKMKEIVLNDQFSTDETVDTNNETDDTDKTIGARLNNVIERDRNTIYGNVSDREYTDLKERIKHLEKQIDRKDQQLQEQADHLKQKSVELIESLKANNTLIENNQELARANTNINMMYAKVLTPPKTEDAITVDNGSTKESSWFGKIFKKNK